MKKIIFILLLFIYSLVLSQRVNYGGSLQSAETKYHSIELKGIEGVEERYREEIKGNKFLFKDILIGKYIRTLRSDKNTVVDTLILEKEILDDRLLISKSIEGVVISAPKNKFIQMKNGIIKVNVQNNPILSSGNVFESISKLPGVSYDAINDRFKLNGNTGIRVEIDGESLLLSGNELMIYLKNLQAAEVESIEINSSPSAKYDAGSGAGIINIKTKKFKKEGVSVIANTNATKGRYFKQSTGAKAQYNIHNKSFVLRYLNSYGGDFEQANSLKGISNSLSSEQETYAKINNANHSIGGTFENRFSHSKLTLNTKLTFYNEDIQQNTDLIFKNNSLPYSEIISRQMSDNSLRTFDVGIRYAYDFKKSSLVLRGNYIRYNTKNNALLSSKEVQNIQHFKDLENRAPNTVNAAVIQVDYTNKIDSTSTIESGLKYIFQDINNKNLFYKREINGWEYDEPKSNAYTYNEHITSAYLQYYKSFKRIDIILGSRAEFSPVYGYSSENDYHLKREELNIFPFINFSYANQSKNHHISLSYNKKINRPNFKNLMPFVYYIDPYTKILGNAELKSNITHQLTLQYLYKQKYIFNIIYSQNRDAIYQTHIHNKATLSSMLTPVNIDKIHSIIFNANLSFNMLKWWSLNANINLFRDSIKSNDNAQNINTQSWAHQWAITNRFSLPAKINLTSGFDFISDFIQGPYKTTSFYGLSLGINRNFMNNQLRFSLTANDVFNRKEIKNHLLAQEQSYFSRQTFDSRWIRLSLTYIFDKGTKNNTSYDEDTVDKLKSRLK